MLEQHYLTTLFEPKSVAVIGASDRENAVGNIIFKNILSSGYKGRVYAINPKHETVQGQRYTAGQEFQAHQDWFRTDVPYWPDEASRGGQRSWTAMAYLNDVAAGGTTAFPRLGVSVEPQAGALLMWNNARVDGTPNEMTMHAALPVVRGSKHIVTRWYRVREWT